MTKRLTRKNDKNRAIAKLKLPKKNLSFSRKVSYEAVKNQGCLEKQLKVGVERNLSQGYQEKLKVNVTKIKVA